MKSITNPDHQCHYDYASNELELSANYGHFLRIKIDKLNVSNILDC